jgi:hypothetical protein
MLEDLEAPLKQKILTTAIETLLNQHLVEAGTEVQPDINEEETSLIPSTVITS